MADQRLADLWREAASGAAEVDERPFDPFAANVLLSAVDSLKLAGLEAMGAPVLRRLTSASRDDPEGERARQRRMDSVILDLLVRQRQWDAQMVTLGGVQMTNAEAQAARQRILDNPDHYVAWAKKRELIRDGEEAALVETVRRLHELNELERNRKLTATQQAEKKALQQSPLGHGAEQATGQAHVDKGRALDAAAGYATRSAMFAGSDPSLPGGEPRYVDRGPITPCFNACASRTESPNVAPDTPVPDEIPKSANTVAATGLDL